MLSDSRRKILVCIFCRSSTRHIDRQCSSRLLTNDTGGFGAFGQPQQQQQPSTGFGTTTQSTGFGGEHKGLTTYSLVVIQRGTADIVSFLLICDSPSTCCRFWRWCWRLRCKACNWIRRYRYFWFQHGFNWGLWLRFWKQRWYKHHIRPTICEHPEYYWLRWRVRLEYQHNQRVGKTSSNHWLWSRR